jgi:hypothetical protein
MIKRFIEKLKTLRLYFVRCSKSSDLNKVLYGLSDNHTRCKNWCGMKWCDKNDCINVSKGFSDETDKTYYT